MAPHSPQPAGGHGLDWESRRRGRADGAANAGQAGGSQTNPEKREAPAGSACQPPAAQAHSGHVALPAPGWPSQSQ